MPKCCFPVPFYLITFSAWFLSTGCHHDAECFFASFGCLSPKPSDKDPNFIFPSSPTINKCPTRLRIVVRHATGLNLSRCSCPFGEENLCRFCETCVELKGRANVVQVFCECFCLFRRQCFQHFCCDSVSTVVLFSLNLQVVICRTFA